MRKHIIFCLSLLIFSSANAQELPDFGPLMEIKRGYLPQIVGESEKEIYAVSYAKETITVETFNKKRLNSVSKKEVEIVELRGVTETLEKLTYLNGEIVYFTSLFNYRDDKFDLIAQKMDPKSGRINDKITLFEKSTDKRYDRGEYDIYLSKNRKRVLVRTYTYYKETEQTVENLLLFNDKLELVAEREYREAGKELNLISSLLVDDEGSIYFVQDGSVVTLDAFNDYEEWREKLPTDDLIVGSSYERVSLTLNKDLDLVISAYYVTEDLEKLDRKVVNKSRANRREGDTQIEGVVYFKINTLDKELETVSHTNFDKDFIELFKTERDLKRGYEGEIKNNYSLNRIISLENGETLLIGEYYQFIVTRDGNGAVIREQTIYGDMILVHFSAEGEILWKDRLLKAQLYYWAKGIIPLTNTSSAGFNFLILPQGIQDYFYDQVIVRDDKVYLIYNDMPENQASNRAMQEVEVYKKFRKGVPVVQTIDLERKKRTGEIERSLVKTKFWLKPGSMYDSDLTDDVFYFVTYKKKMHLAKARFK